jgi:hypothetical protein
MHTLMIRVSAVRLSFDRFISIGMISSGPFIIIGTEQIRFPFVCSSSLDSVKPRVEFEQDITHE